jgi:hypothetical protein
MEYTLLKGKLVLWSFSHKMRVLHLPLS